MKDFLKTVKDKNIKQTEFSVKDFFKTLKDKNIKALLIELGPDPKVLFTEADKDFPDALAQGAVFAVLRIARLNGDDPEQVAEALLAHMATKMHALLRKSQNSN